MTSEMYYEELNADLTRLFNDHSAMFESIYNSDNYDSYALVITEASDGSNDNIIVRLFRAISNFIQKAIDKFKSLFSGGATLDPRYKNAPIDGKDPKLVAKFINGDFKSSKEVLAKAQRGQLSVEEANSFVNRQKSKFDAIKSSAIPAALLFTGAFANEACLKKWKQECDAAMSDVQRMDNVDYSNKVANTLDARGKKTIANEASKIIVAHMNDSMNSGISSIFNPIKTLFAKGYVKSKIINDARKRNDPNYRKEIKQQSRMNLKNAKKSAEQLYKDKENRDKNQKAYSKGLDARYKSKNILNKAVKDTFDDTKGIYVDKKALR